jgi:hypothetical protein
MTDKLLQLTLLPTTDVPELPPEQRQRLITLVAELLLEARSAEALDEQR